MDQKDVFDLVFPQIVTNIFCEFLQQTKSTYILIC